MVALQSNKMSQIIRKTVVITGASDGIGKHAVKHLVDSGAHVVLACRSKEKTMKVMEDIQQATETDAHKQKGSMEFMHLDLADLDSVKEFAMSFLDKKCRLDALICNAGVWLGSEKKKTKQQIELTIGTNHMSYFYLVHLLLDKLKESQPSRLVIVSSGLHKNGKISQLLTDPNLEQKNAYSGKQAYCNSKLANVLFGYALVRHLNNADPLKKQCGISVHVIHPGVVGGTGLFTEAFGSWVSPILKLVLQKPEHASQCLAYHALDPEVEGVTGMKFYDQWKEKNSCNDSYVEKYQDALWEMSKKQVGLSQ